MKVFLEKETEIFINGKLIVIQSGIQEPDDNLCQILIDSGYAKEIKEENKKKDK